MNVGANARIFFAPPSRPLKFYASGNMSRRPKSGYTPTLMRLFA